MNAEQCDKRAEAATTEAKRIWWKQRADALRGNTRPVKFAKRFKGVTRKQRNTAIQGHLKEQRRIKSVFEKSPALQLFMFTIGDTEKPAVPQLAPLLAEDIKGKNQDERDLIAQAQQLFNTEAARLVAAGRIPKARAGKR